MADTTTEVKFAHCRICKRVLKPDEPHDHPFTMVSGKDEPFAAVIDASEAKTSEELALLLARVRFDIRTHVQRVFRIDVIPSRYELFRGGGKMTTEFDRARPIEFIAVEA